jgi:uncharacterized protein (UPF0332 family)
VTEAPLAPADLELARARRMLEAATALHGLGFHEDAVSRAYYAVFHAASALLATIGRTVRTQDGLRAAIGQHFVRAGLLEPRFARVLARVAADRNDADYNAAAAFGPEDSLATIADARAFVDAAEALVARGA